MPCKTALIPEMCSVEGFIRWPAPTDGRVFICSPASFIHTTEATGAPSGIPQMGWCRLASRHNRGEADDRAPRWRGGERGVGRRTATNTGISPVGWGVGSLESGCEGAVTPYVARRAHICNGHAYADTVTLSCAMMSKHVLLGAKETHRSCPRTSI